MPVDELLRRHELSLAPLTNAAMQVEQLERIRLRNTVPRQNLVRYQWRANGDRAFANFKRWRDVRNPDHPTEYELRETAELTLTGGRLFLLHARTRTREPYLYISHVSAGHRDEAWLGPLLLGYFPGDSVRVGTVLEAAKESARVQTDSKAGFRCISVHSKLKDISYSVWFALERDCAIVRMTRIQEGESLRRRELAARRAEGTTPASDGSTWTRLTQTVHDVQLAYVESHWIPVGATCTEELVHEDGSLSVTTTVVRRSGIEFNPIIPEMILNYPDGTPVRFVADSSPVPHEWRNGSVIPREDKEATVKLTAAVAGQRFVARAALRWEREAARGPAMFLALVGGLFSLEWLYLHVRRLRAPSHSGT